MNKNIVLKKRDTNWRWRHALGFKLIPSKKVYSRKKSTKLTKDMKDVQDN